MNVEAVREQSWDEYFVELDKKADYVPIVSTLTNVADLVLKGAISLMDQERLESALQSHFFKHINDKNAARSVALLVPVVGNGIVYFYDRDTGKVSEPEVVDDEGEAVPLEEAVAILQQAVNAPEIETPVTVFIPVHQEKPQAYISAHPPFSPIIAHPKTQEAPPAPPASPVEKLPLLKPKLIKAGLKIRI